MNQRQRDEFDRELEKIIDELPPPTRKLLDEVPIIVEDEPAAGLLDELGIECDDGDDSDLCGAHSGTPLDRRSVFDPESEARIFLFRGPLLRLTAGRRQELVREIRTTLLHELGHHYGMSEEDLSRLGYD